MKAKKSFYLRVVLLISVFLVVPVVAFMAGATSASPGQAAQTGAGQAIPAQGQGGQLGQPMTPLKELLNEDGSINATTGFSGSLDPTGWQMETGKDGRPRFKRVEDVNPQTRPRDSLTSGVRNRQEGPAAPGDENWDDRFGPPGLNGYVYAIAVNGADVYVGGQFTAVSGSYIARWNGRTWSGLGSGVNGFVRAIAVHGTDVYVGGDFTQAGGVSANRVAKWNGSSWSALGSGVNGVVHAIAVAGSGIYVGGEFTQAGGQSANYIARWTGTSWATLGSGASNGVNSHVYAIKASGTSLYVGGYFTGAGGQAANRIAKWNPGTSQWSTLGSGANNGVGGTTYPRVFEIAVSGSDVYVGGDFNQAGGVSANYIARWNGSSWSALGSGTNNNVHAITIATTGVYVGGEFTTAGGTTVNYIAKWSGSTWSALGSGVDASVFALGANGGDVYAGGFFTRAGTTLLYFVGKWNDSSQWSALGAAIIHDTTLALVNAMAISGTNLYVGGLFITADGVGANYIARWDTVSSQWHPLGAGVNDQVYALAVSGTDVYVGGYLTSAGGVPVNRVAKWNGSSWSALGTGIESTSGTSTVYAIAVNGSDVYVGGAFNRAGGLPVNNIARWNGSIWSALGTGTNNSVFALAVSGSDVYVGGAFTSAGGVVTTGIARWNGSSWSAVGGGMNNSVFALAVSGSNVYAGGAFTVAGGVGANYIARWDGSSWSAKGTGVNNWVRSIAASGSNVYVGGYFTTAGGVSANRIARWNGSSWSALGSGLDDYVIAVAASGSNVYAGGALTQAGGQSANRVARWDGSQWSRLNNGVTVSYSYPFIYAIAVSGSNVYVGGIFTSAGGQPVNNIARWDGTRWYPLGSGMNNTVIALAVSGSDLYAGGYFTVAGGVSASRIARWNGSSWSALGSGVTGGGTSEGVFALAVSGSNVYAGGNFTVAGGVGANYIARWNGSSWSALGTGTDDWVLAIAVSGSNVYAGGWFTLAGGIGANYIAQWNGSSWSALGTGMNSIVEAIAVSGSNVYAGGSFTVAGGVVARSIARWNGSSWSSLGTAFNTVVGSVNEVAVLGTNVYVGGFFVVSVTGGNANNTARWSTATNQWYTLGSGLDWGVEGMDTGSSGDVYFGGQFFTAGTRPSLNIALWHDPAVATPTATATVVPGRCLLEFSDVPDTNTFYPYVICLACKSILGGYADGTFRPNADVTRGQLSKIVANSAGFNEPVSGQTFQDVPPSNSFYQFVERMSGRGIIGGYPCGGQGEPCVPPTNRPYFRPNANATRGQISKVVSEAAGYTDPPSGQTFQDVPPSGTFYVWVERLASRGIMGGYACGNPEPCVPPANRPYFRPNNNATRGQVSKIVANTFFPSCQVLR